MAEENQTEQQTEVKPKKKMPLWAIITIVAAVVVCLGFFIHVINQRMTLM